jgi:adenosylcobinamide-GDP ribazoletransferase
VRQTERRVKATTMLDGVRLAFSTLTALPIGPPRRVERDTAGRAMAAGSLVGFVLGVIAAAVSWAAWRWSGSALIAATAGVGTMAALTRGLHLDGLADTADGLGSAKPAADALRIMKASDIGPFGVITLVLVLLGQTALLAAAWQHGESHGASALVVAAMTGRLAVTWGCRAGVPSARPDGLGAWVAGSVSRTALAVATAATLAVATAAGWLVTDISHLALWPLAVIVGVAASAVMLRHATTRFGGITGDVLGALVEIAFTAALVVLAR